MTRVGITTIDNPYNPITDFSNWFKFDSEKGYYTCAYLGRLTNTSPSMSDEENAQEIQRAIDEMLKYDFTGKLKKVVFEEVSS